MSKKSRRRQSRNLHTSCRPALSIQNLENRRVMATAVAAESTFDIDAFGENIEDVLQGEALPDRNVVGFAYSLTERNVDSPWDGYITVENAEGDARDSVDAPQQDFTTLTKVEIASVSKTVSAVATLKSLEDQFGDVASALDMPITDFLPEDWDPGTNVNQITIRNLLTHTSGLQETGNPPGINFNSFSNGTYADLQALVEQTNLPAPTLQPQGFDGWTYAYNNANFGLVRVMLGYINGLAKQLDAADNPAQETADAYRDYVRDNVLSETLFEDADLKHNEDNPAFGYVFNTPQTAGMQAPDRTLTAGGFGWKMSATGLQDFLAHLEHNDAILSAPTRQLMKDQFLGFADATQWGLASGLFGTYAAHAGDWNNVGESHSVVFTFEHGPDTRVHASAVINSDNESLPSSLSNVLENAYEDAWSGIVIEGDDGDNVFRLRLNGGDPTMIDLVDESGPTTTLFTNPISVLQSLEIRGLGGNDTFIIEDLPESLDLILSGGADDDTFQIGNSWFATNISGNISVLGTSGFDTLQIEDELSGELDYTITGETIDSTSYSNAKTFAYDAVEHVVLEASNNSNEILVQGINGGTDVDIFAANGDDQITVSDIDNWIEINLDGGQDDDTFTISDIGATVDVSISGDGVNLIHGKDELYVGDGDFDSVRGSVTFEGDGNYDRLYIDDSSAGDGLVGEFNEDSGQYTFTSDGSLGVVRFDIDTEWIRFDGSPQDDTINVEKLGHATLTLYGNDGDDLFTMSETNHDVNGILGQVFVHGGQGKPKNSKTATAEDFDQLLVFDDGTKSSGDFTIDIDSSVFDGVLQKTEDGKTSRFRVFFDEIEQGSLHADDKSNSIRIHSVPWFTAFAVHAGGGDDQISIDATLANAGLLEVFADGGADEIDIAKPAKSLSLIDANVYVDGGPDKEEDILTVYDSFSGNTNPYTLTKSSFSRAGSSGIEFDGVDEMMIWLSDEDNTIDVQSTAAGTETLVLGRAGDDTLIASNLQSGLYFMGHNGEDSAILKGSRKSEIVTVQGETMSLGAGSLTVFNDVEQRSVDMLGGLDTMMLDGMDGIDEAFGISPSSTQAQGSVALSPFAPIEYKNLENVEVRGNSADNDSLQIFGQTEPNAIWGGFYDDRFDINLTAEGTTKDPMLRLRNSVGKSLLAVSQYSDIGVAEIHGLHGADIFNINIDPQDNATSQQLLIDGGSELGADDVDQLFVNYASEGANVEDSSDEIDIDYLSLLFEIDYDDIEEVQLLPS